MYRYRGSFPNSGAARTGEWEVCDVRNWLVFALFGGLCFSHAVFAEPQGAGPEGARLAAPPDDMFVDVRVPAHQIYLGETMRVAYDVYVASSRGQVFYNVAEPDFAHWYVVEGRTAPVSHTSFEGKSYTQEPFAVFFVTALTSGKISLPPLKVEVPYIASKPWVMNTPRIVEVLPLPEPRPSDMAIGNVGNFEISATLSNDEVRVGDVINLKVTVFSDSPAAGIELAPYILEENPDAFRVYPVINDVTEEKVVGDQLKSRRVFRIRLLAQKPGKYRISPAGIVVFEPKHHQYRRLETDSFEVHVSEGELPDEEVRAQTHRLDSGAIRPIRLDVSRCQRVPSLGWLFVAPVGLLGWFSGRMIMRRIRRMRGYAEKIRAADQLQERLGNAETAQEQLDVINQFYDLIEEVQGADAMEDSSVSAVIGESDAARLKDCMSYLKCSLYGMQKPLEKASVSFVGTALSRLLRGEVGK